MTGNVWPGFFKPGPGCCFHLADMGCLVFWNNLVRLPEQHRFHYFDNTGFITNTRYFDSRFDLLQVQFDSLQKGQNEVKSQILRLEDQVERRFERSDEILKGFKSDVDKRFEKSDQSLNDFKSLVDKRFEQMVASIDRFTEKLDHRDEKLRGFTIRMFNIAIMLSFLGALGAMLKIIGWEGFLRHNL
jgi:hypothetical protein